MRVLGMEDSISYGEEVTLVEDVKEKVEDGMEEPPDWLLDGWIMDIVHGANGALFQVCCVLLNIWTNTCQVDPTHVHS